MFYYTCMQICCDININFSNTEVCACFAVPQSPIHLHNAEFTYKHVLTHLFFLCSTMYVLYIDALIVIVTNICIYLLHDISSMDI